MKLERSVVVNALVVVCALGTGVALIATRDKPTTSERDARENNLFVDFSRERLERVTIHTPGHSFTLAIERGVDAGEPRYVLEGLGLAEPEAATGLVRSLELAGFLKRFDANDSDRKAFGLDPPQAQVRVDSEQGASVLSVGKAALTPSDTTYVEVESHGERRIGLVRNETVKQLLVDVDELRPHGLVPYGVSELRALEFHDGTVSASLQRAAGPAWVDVHGQRVLRDSVEHLLLELATVKIREFVPTADAAERLNHDGALSATLRPTDGSTALALRVGSSCPGHPELLLAERKRTDAVAGCVSAGVRRLFSDAAATLNDDTPFSLHRDEIESLVIERGDKRLELVRNERGFTLRGPTPTPVELDTGNRRLDALLDVHGEPITDANLTELGLSPPAGNVRLRSSSLPGSDRFEELLELGRADAQGRLPVRRALDGRVLRLSRDAARAFVADATLLRSTRLFDFSPSELTSLDVSFGSEHERLRRGANGELELLEPAGFAHDGNLALELVQALATLHAVRWVADSDDGTFGLQKPRARARFELTDKDGAHAHTLTIGARTTGGEFAVLDTTPGVFVVERGVFETLTTLVISRALFNRDPDDLERVEITTPGREVVLVRKDDRFVSKGADLPADSTARLLDSATALRAEAAVHTGAPRAEEGFAKPTLTVRVTPRPGRGHPNRFTIGIGDSFHDTRVFYARIDGVDATFAVPYSEVRAVLDAL